MAIESVPYKSGAGRAKAVCDDCGREEIVPCVYTGRGDNIRPNASQARANVIKLGWRYVKKKLRCPSCEAKRKVVPMATKETVKAPEPTKKERLNIIALLNEVYDLDAGRYANGDTDETVAEVLELMPGFVAQIREAEFGPDGGNENMEELSERLGRFEKDFPSIIRAAEQVTTQAQKKLAEVSAMKADLERIKKAVGPRVMRASGVK